MLVTGGAGFVGRFLVNEIRSDRRFSSSLIDAPSKATLDLLQSKETARFLERTRPDLVFHVAGLSDPGARENELWDGHVRTTFHLMEAVRRLPAPSRPMVVIAGSAAEYGIPARLPVRENDPLAPVTPYGRAKAAQSALALSYAPLGIRVVVGRIFNLLGPGLPSSLAAGSLCEQVAALEKKGQSGSIRIGDLTTQRDYVDVRDVARAFVQLAEKGIFGEVYNICSGRTVSLRLIVAALRGASRANFNVTVDRGRRRGGPGRFRGTPEKIFRHTGWKPRLSWRDSLLDTLEFYRESR